MVDKERDAVSTYSKPPAPRLSSVIVSDKTISGGNFGPVGRGRSGETASHQRTSSDQSHSSGGTSTPWSFGSSGQRACCLDKKKNSAGSAPAIAVRNNYDSNLQVDSSSSGMRSRYPAAYKLFGDSQVSSTSTGANYTDEKSKWLNGLFTDAVSSSNDVVADCAT